MNKTFAAPFGGDRGVGTSGASPIRDGLKQRLPVMREGAPVISIPLRIPASTSHEGHPCNVYLPPGFAMSPDGLFRWGTDAYPLLSGDSQQHTLKSAQQQWWSSYSASDSTAQAATVSSILSNVLDMRHHSVSAPREANRGSMFMSDDSVDADDLRAQRVQRRLQQHSAIGEAVDGICAPSAAVDSNKQGSIYGSDSLEEARDCSVSVPPLLRPHAAETPLQAYFLPADGVPIPLGGRGQPPVSYFNKVSITAPSCLPFHFRTTLKSVVIYSTCDEQAMPRDTELRKLSYTAAILLKTWFARHWLDPRPTPAEIHTLTRATGLSTEQVIAWFRNERWRFMSDECPVHHRPVYHAATVPGTEAGAIVATTLDTNDSSQPTSNSASGAVQELTPLSMTARDHCGIRGTVIPNDGVLPWDSRTRLHHTLSHHNTVLVRPGSRGALRPRTFLASDGIPLALPDYSILTSDGHVLVPASALPEGATPLGPVIFVAMDAFRGPLVPEMQWDTSIMRKRGDTGNSTAETRRRDPKAAAATRGSSSLISSEQWVPGTVPQWLSAARFSALPANVQLLLEDGSVPPGADFVVLPTAAGTIMLAQVCKGF